MKLKDKYKNLKRNYNEYLILLKTGGFYSTFSNDAYILNYLFGYVITNDKVGFPIVSLDKVLEVLKNNQISVIVDDLVITCNDNRYNEFFTNSNKNYLYEENLNNLIKEIKLITRNNYGKIEEIRSFVHEL